MGSFFLPLILKEGRSNAYESMSTGLHRISGQPDFYQLISAGIVVHFRTVCTCTFISGTVFHVVFTRILNISGILGTPGILGILSVLRISGILRILCVSRILCILGIPGILGILCVSGVHFVLIG